MHGEDRKTRRKRSKSVKEKNREWFFQNKIIRILLVCLCTVIYILINSVFDLNNPLKELLSNGILAFDTVLIADLLINFNYIRHIKDELYDILTNSKVMKDFIDFRFKREILCAAMQANLGNDITEALYNNILDNYLDTYNKILRENYQFNVYLENSLLNHFYSAYIQIVFKIPQHDEDLELNVFSCKDHNEIKEKIANISELNKQLVFPLILAKGVDEIESEEKFKVDINIDNKDVTDYIVNNNEEKKVKIAGSSIPIYVKIYIRTLLNKEENFFQEDIFCIHKGYSLTFGYDSGMFSGCQCYHSCKSSELITITNKNSINIYTNGVLLPENNFVFIWEKK